MGGRIQWSLEELSASLRERAPEVDGARVDLALGLLRLPLERQRWYSECYPVAEAHVAVAALAEWRALAPVIEPLLISERPAYEYTWHPLPALIIASQFLWHWWELREAAPLIERAIDLAETAKTPDGLIIQGRERIAGEVAGDRWGDHPYSDPRFYPMGWHFLAEIAEAEGRPADALAWYERFIAAEPDFAPLADFKLDEWFFYGKRYPPNTVEACRRAGRCAEAIGDEGRARRLTGSPSASRSSGAIRLQSTPRVGEVAAQSRCVVTASPLRSGAGVAKPQRSATRRGAERSHRRTPSISTACSQRAPTRMSAALRSPSAAGSVGASATRTPIKATRARRSEGACLGGTSA